MPILNIFTVGDDVTLRSKRHGGIFLAGPVERVVDGAEAALPRWRVEALNLLNQYDDDLVIYSPEWTAKPANWTYEKQVAWEITAMRWADAILCWIPRQLPLLPGFTTNIEVGEYLSNTKLFVGAPPETPHTKYIQTRLSFMKRPWFCDLPTLVEVAVKYATDAEN